MNRNALIEMIARLRIFIISVCLVNFTACSAKNKISTIAGDVKERSVTTGSHTTMTDEAERSEIDSSDNQYTIHKIDFNAVADSIKRKATVNRRGVDKRDIKIDSITSNNSAIYGIVVSERSSATINSDETIDAFGFEVLLNVEDQQEGETHLVRTDEMTKQEKTKSSFKANNEKDGSNTLESSEKNTPWMLLILNTLFTSWWFWVVTLLAGVAVYKRVTGVNLLQVAILKVKSWFS